MILVTAAIITDESKILIARRGPEKHLAGFWEFPGGKIEKDETPEECLKREIKEELGLDIEIKSFFMENVYQYPNKKILLKAYLCKRLSGSIVLKDHDKIEWVDIIEIDNYKFAPADIAFIDKLKTK